jgi:predicted RNase H-like HicB family nuclease
LEAVTYAVVVHKAGSSWNAYVPDLEGVYAAGDTRDEVLQMIAEAIPFHLESLAKDGLLPPDVGTSEVVTIFVPSGAVA